MSDNHPESSGRVQHTGLHQPTMNTPTPWRRRLADWIDTKPIQRAITLLILINALVLGLETSDQIMAAWGPWLIAADQITPFPSINPPYPPQPGEKAARIAPVFPSSLLNVLGE